MSYLAKRKFELRPVLDKKKDIELAVVEVRAKQEVETAKLDRIKTDLNSAGLELVEIDKELTKVTEGCEKLSGEVSEYVKTALQGVVQTDEVLEKYLLFISHFDKQINTQKEELKKVEERKEQALLEISKSQGLLSRREKDLDIYKHRLQKYIEESGANIKLLL